MRYVQNFQWVFPNPQRNWKLGFLKFLAVIFCPIVRIVFQTQYMEWRGGANVHIYIIILCQFKCCKTCFQSKIRVKIKFFLGMHCLNCPKPPSCFWNELYLSTNALLSSDFSQYAIFSQSLINGDFFYVWYRPCIPAWNWKPNHLFKHLKALLMIGLDLSGCVKKECKMRNK